MKSGIALFLLILLMALGAQVLTPYSPSQYDLTQKLLSPSSHHLLGTDGTGADVWTLLVYGARLSLRIAFVVVFASAIIGGLIGSLAGYFGGWVDQILMRIIDMLYAFPGFLLALAIVAFLGPGVNNLILALTVTGWTAYARLIRAEIQSLKTKEFITAARALGASHVTIIVRHLWPNLVSLLCVQATFGLAATVVNEAGLSFLGLGAPAHQPSWGSLLGSGRKYLIQAPHVSLFPGVAIMLLVLSFNLIGDGLRRKLNPRS